MPDSMVTKLVELWESQDMDRYRTMRKGGWENKYRTAFTRLRYMYDHCALHCDGITRFDPHHSALLIDARRNAKKQTVSQLLAELKKRDMDVKPRAPKGGSSRKCARIHDEAAPQNQDPWLARAFRQPTLPSTFEQQVDQGFEDDEWYIGFDPYFF